MADSGRGRPPVLQPVAASLDNPLYYLENFDTVVAWVRRLHGDLLTADERRQLADLAQLPETSRALLARLVMRSGSLFRRSRLNYPELGVATAIVRLAEEGWLATDPELSFADFCRLFTLPELRQALAGELAAAGLKPGVSKKVLVDTLSGSAPALQSLQRWWPGTEDQVVALHHMALFDRIRLMFFGNLRQGWADFVLSELGIYRYEAVPLTADSRAFRERTEVDAYLRLHACRERLDGGEPPSSVWPEVPAEEAPNGWLESRRGRLLFELGRLAERSGDRELALAAWARSRHREGRLRYLRLLERLGRYEEAWQVARSALAAPRNVAEEEGLQRLLGRMARKLGQPAPAKVASHQPREYHLTLPPYSGPVEAAVVAHWHRTEAPVFYVENTLFNGLLGLLCWPVLYAPLPGAFFHPFQPGPADLYREDFVPRREALFESCLEMLEQGDYRDVILTTWQQKHGIANPLVAWQTLTDDLLRLALDCIPASHLAAIFRRMLQDLKANASGLPDLIRLDPAAAQYELVEVKGPGDRLQDHQRRWLAWFADHEIPAAVCYVRWQDPQ